MGGMYFPPLTIFLVLVPLPCCRIWVPAFESTQFFGDYLQGISASSIFSDSLSAKGEMEAGFSLMRTLSSLMRD